MGHPPSLASEELAKLLALRLGDRVWKWAVTQDVMVAKLPEVGTACFPQSGPRLMLARSRHPFIL